MDLPALGVDWPGIVLGIAITLPLERAFLSLERRWRRRRRTGYYTKTNRAWTSVEALWSTLSLVQAGWDEDGFFPEGAITFELDGEFALQDPDLIALRELHHEEWLTQEFFRGEQVGMRALEISRRSDMPEDDRGGTSHQIIVSAHRYGWLDFLATHSLRLSGSVEERALLERHAQPYGPAILSSAFPNPCSVGASVLCEEGSVLVLPRRSQKLGSGGHWSGGKIFNGVGENTSPRDFSVSPDGKHISSPGTVLERGLYEEMGFSLDDIQDCDMRIHSLAWATDLLDHKFFGVVTTPLSRSEVSTRWREAPDRRESDGDKPRFVPVATTADCRKLLKEIRNNAEDWAPEAVFATVRTLVTLGRIQPAHLLDLTSTKSWLRSTSRLAGADGD